MTRALDALKLAAETFRWYEQLDRAKPDHKKADYNKELAEIMEQALQPPDVDRAGEDEALERLLMGDLRNLAAGVYDGVTLKRQHADWLLKSLTRSAADRQENNVNKT